METFESMQNKYADLQLETKRLEMDKQNLNNTKEEEQSSFRNQIDQTNLGVMQTKGNLEFAKKEQDNLINEIKADRLSNDEQLQNLIESCHREKDELMKKIQEQKQSNYETLDNIKNTKHNLGSELSRVDDLVKGQTINLDTFKREGDL